MFTVYALHSPSFNQIYIGFTSDLPNRFLSHNELATKGHTIKYRPWVIAYSEEYETKTETMLTENQLKSAYKKAPSIKNITPSITSRLSSIRRSTLGKA